MSVIPESGPSTAPGRLGATGPLAMGLALALVTLWTFLPALENGFVNFDDDLYATEAPWSRSDEVGLDSVLWAFGANYVASNWHPLTVLSHMTDRALFGLDPRGHHLSSVVFHVANTALLFLLLFSTTGALARSALATALFSLHPLRVESVAWVSERKDVLSTFFALLTLLAFVRFSRTRSVASGFATVLLFAAGLASKPMVVTLPFVMLLLAMWPLRRVDVTSPRIPVREVRTVLLEQVPLLALSFGAGLATLAAQAGAIEASEAYPAPMRCANAALSGARYLAKTLVPVNLSVFYPYPDPFPWGRAALAAAGLALGTILVLRRLRKTPWLAVGWLWFFVTLAPVLGILKVGDQAMADRFTYLPSIGLAVVLAWGMAALAERTDRRTFVAGLAVLLLGALSVQTRRQIGVWRDSESLFRHAVDVTGGSSLAHLNLAEALWEGGRVEEAAGHYRLSLEHRPDVAEALGGLARTEIRSGDLTGAEANVRRALDIAPEDYRLWVTLGSAQAAAGHLDEAREALQRASKIRPTAFEPHWGLADLAARQGAHHEAVLHSRKALELAPWRTDLRQLHARFLARSRQEQRDAEGGDPPESAPAEELD